MSKTIAVDQVEKKIIIPVSKKLASAVGMREDTFYLAYYEDGLLVIGESDAHRTVELGNRILDIGYERGYDAGFQAGEKVAFSWGYRQGYDDAAEGYDYRETADCGVDCDYDCEHCRMNDQ